MIEEYLSESNDHPPQPEYFLLLHFNRQCLILQICPKHNFNGIKRPNEYKYFSSLVISSLHLPLFCLPGLLTKMLTSLIILAALTAPTVLAVPATTTNASDECRQLDAGRAPAPSPNTPPSFLDFAYYGQTAENATHPLNYERFMVAEHASLHDDAAYVTYAEMETYDAGACARRCDEEKTCASCEQHPVILPESTTDITQSTSTSNADQHRSQVPPALTQTRLSLCTAPCSAHPWTSAKRPTTGKSVDPQMAQVTSSRSGLQVAMVFAFWSLSSSTIANEPQLTTDSFRRAKTVL